MRIFILMLIIISPANADFLKYDYSAEMEDATYFTNRTSFVKIDEEIYRFEQAVYTHNIFTLKEIKDSTKTIVLEFPEIKSRVESQSTTEVRLMDYDNGLLVIKIDRMICIFNKYDGFKLQKYYDLDKIFPNKKYVSAEKLCIKDYKVIGIYDHFSTFDVKGEQFYFWTIDLKNDANNKFTSLEPPAAYYYTIFQPRNIMDYSKNKILTSEIIDYKIYIRDMDGKIQDSISRDIEDWVFPNLNEENEGQDPRETIRQIQSDTSKLSLMHRVDFLTYSKILVTYSMEHRRAKGDEDTYNLYYDTWEYENGEWILTDKDVSHNQMEKQDYTDANLTFDMDYYIFGNSFVHPYYNRNTYSDYRIIVRDIE